MATKDAKKDKDSGAEESEDESLKNAAEETDADEETAADSMSVEELNENEFGDDENDEEVLAESRPKTAADQRRVLKIHRNPKGAQLMGAARRRLSEEEKDDMSDDDYKSYLEEELANLQHYGRVKLTPKGRNTKKVALHRYGGAQDKSSGNLVKVTMFRTLDPAPTVGRVNVVTDFGYEKLVEGETYLLPKNVATIIAEGRAGAMHDE